MKRLATIVALTALALTARAHGGEDHDDAAVPPDVVVEAGARASGAGEDFEFVAVPQGAQLLIYLDRFATNEPVIGAALELESGAFKATARTVGPGVYAVAGDAFKAPGRHLLTLAVQTGAPSGAVSDLLSATLEVAPPAAGDAPPARPWTRGTRLGLAALALLALIAAIAFAVRRRARRTAAPGREMNHAGAEPTA